MAALSTLSFLVPAALALAVLAIPIILLYMLCLRRTEMPVSSTFLWQQLVRDREANAPWQRLRWNWLLLLQLLILAALVLALARPFVEVKTITTGRIVLLLDASASMTATDVEPSRFAVARSIGLDMVDTLGPDDTMTVIRVGAVPEVLAAASRDRLVLREAIESAEAGEVSADWQAAMTLAAAGAVGVDALNVVLISDGGLPPDLPPIPGNVRYVPVGESASNLAISALAVGDLPGQPPQLFMRLTNYGDEPMDAVADLRLDGEDAIYWAYRYTVPAHGYVDITEIELPEDFDTVRASLTLPAGSGGADHLAVDNVAYAVRNRAGAERVLLVMAEENIFLRQIFRSLPAVDVFEAGPDAGLPDQPFDLYVFDGWLPDTLPAGDVLFVNPPEGTALFDVEAARPGSGSLVVNGDDPRVRNLRPYASAITIREIRPLGGIDWATTLARVGNEPVIVAGENDDRQVAILAFDSRYPNTDFVLQPAWPILMAELVNWFAPPRAIEAVEGVAPGTPVRVRFVEDADRAVVTRPDGSRARLEASASSTLYADTFEPGVYEVALYAGDALLRSDAFAVNLFDEAESRIAPTTSVTLGTTTIAQDTREETGRREGWPWLAALALLILAVEWWLYHRNRRRVPRAAWTIPRGDRRPPSLRERLRAPLARRRGLASPRTR